MLEDVAVMADVAAVDGFATQWLKVLVRRPRPERYTAQGAQFAGIVEDSRAFPSGHTSFAFAAAVAAASILQRRGELRQHRVETLLLFSGAVATSILRVTSHRHFPTDVVGGAVLGSAIGWIVPQLHGHY
jgi:membrane-associated phospholipid phosphatase